MSKKISRNLENISISSRVEELLCDSGYRFEVSEDLNMLSIRDSNGDTVYEIIVTTDSHESTIVMEEERYYYCDYIEILAIKYAKNFWKPFLEKW